MRLLRAIGTTALGAAVGSFGCGVTLEPPERDLAGAGASLTGQAGPPNHARAASSNSSSSTVGARATSTAAAGSPSELQADEPEETPPVRRPSSWSADRSLGGVARMEAAQRAREPVVRALFDAAHVPLPPAQLLLRAFKRERRLEVWAQPRLGEPFAHVTTYEICRFSGRLGPKRRQGDGQVPEGFYTLGYLNPSSPYHLAMLVTYPNESDRILGDRRDPGGEIMIHGDCRSAGCLAMSDERIEELWVMATSVIWKIGGKVAVHVFPSRDMKELLASEAMPEHRELWQDLAQGLEYFELRKQLPRIQIDSRGRYQFR